MYQVWLLLIFTFMCQFCSAALEKDSGAATQKLRPLAAGETSDTSSRRGLLNRLFLKVRRKDSTDTKIPPVSAGTKGIVTRRSFLKACAAIASLPDIGILISESEETKTLGLLAEMFSSAPEVLSKLERSASRLEELSMYGSAFKSVQEGEFPRMHECIQEAAGIAKRSARSKISNEQILNVRNRLNKLVEKYVVIINRLVERDPDIMARLQSFLGNPVEFQLTGVEVVAKELANHRIELGKRIKTMLVKDEQAPLEALLSADPANFAQALDGLTCDPHLEDIVRFIPQDVLSEIPDATQIETHVERFYNQLSSQSKQLVEKNQNLKKIFDKYPQGVARKPEAQTQGLAEQEFREQEYDSKLMDIWLDDGGAPRQGRHQQLRQAQRAFSEAI